MVRVPAEVLFQEFPESRIHNVNLGAGHLVRHAIEEFFLSQNESVLAIVLWLDGFCFFRSFNSLTSLPVLRLLDDLDPNMGTWLFLEHYKPVVRSRRSSKGLADQLQTFSIGFPTSVFDTVTPGAPGAPGAPSTPGGRNWGPPGKALASIGLKSGCPSDLLTPIGPGPGLASAKGAYFSSSSASRFSTAASFASSDFYPPSAKLNAEQICDRHSPI